MGPVRVSTDLSFDFAFKDKIIVDKQFPPPPSISPPPAANNEAASTPASNDARQSGIAPPQRIRVASGVTQGMVLYKVQPVYPPDARWRRIQGTVILAAVIGKDGKIKDLRTLSGPKELIDAAIGAVQQWRYRPYVLLGNPVEVDTQITVNFQLR
jgi:TonB family protein